MDVVQRFLDYVKYNTQSSDDSNTIPTTKNQLTFAHKLGDELKKLGLNEVSVDDNGYVMATLPGNVEQKAPVIGFIAHLDTSPDFSGENVQPRLVRDYDGGNIFLNREKDIYLSPADFPELEKYRGKDLITTDGSTLLGADDKAGIAEIITAAEYILNHPEIPHGEIKIAFTPDEEVGQGADHFNLDKFEADFAYTVDGGPIGELEYENFNAASARITINGVSVHPGTAKGKMINSMLIASELISSLPSAETPATTSGYQGFYHLLKMQGNVEKTVLNYIIRDFDREGFASRKETIKELVQDFNNRYGEDRIELDLKDQYYNMKEIIEEHQYTVELARQAMEEVGVKPIIKPIRGGTDGARLSYMGLPTPNLFSGGHNYHGNFEFIPVFAMEKSVEVILQIIQLNLQNTD